MEEIATTSRIEIARTIARAARITPRQALERLSRIERDPELRQVYNEVSLGLEATSIVTEVSRGAHGVEVKVAPRVAAPAQQRAMQIDIAMFELRRLGRRSLSALPLIRLAELGQAERSLVRAARALGYAPRRA